MYTTKLPAWSQIPNHHVMSGKELSIKCIFHSFVRIPSSIFHKEKVTLRLPFDPCRDQSCCLLQLRMQRLVAIDLLSVAAF